MIIILNSVYTASLRDPSLNYSHYKTVEFTLDVIR